MKMPEGFICEDSIRPFLQKVFDGEYEIPLKLEAESPVILDVGANVGSFALWAVNRWPGSVIHCYEPHPVTFKTLEENAKLTHERIILQNFAVGIPGTALLHEGVNNSGEATLYGGNAVDSGITHEVEVRSPLTLPEADILKVDAEGSEIAVIEPLILSGRRFAAVMFEYHRINDRRYLDNLLVDYTLVGAHVTGNPALGTLRYIHSSLLTEPRTRISLV